MQIYKQVARLTECFPEILTDYLFGGKKTSIPNPSIVISTLAQIKTCQAKKILQLSSVERLIVDEADHVFESDFNRNFISNLIDRLFTQPNFKIIFTSATMTPDFKKVI